MADLFMVMDALKRCAYGECNDKCPYNVINCGCKPKLMLDALELLKGQQRTGKWVDEHCSECGKYVYHGDTDNYCPHCGARM